jgi:hypothetical protein
MDLSLAELAEAEAMYQLESGAPPPVRSALGIGCCRIGGGVALVMRRDTSRYWSKALGLGFAEPVTGPVIERLCDFYLEQGVSEFVLQLAHSVLPVGWDSICAAHDLYEGNRWLKLVHGLADIPDVPRTAPRVTAVGPDQAREWAHVMVRGFGMTDRRLTDMVAATVGQPGFRAYAAWDGAAMIAAANMFFYQDVAAFAGAATLPEFRCRGAQAALLAARLRDARAAGCRVAFAETALQLTARNPSLHNMRRAGFDVLYERVNWLWRPLTA